MKKSLFGIAALLLALAACNKVETEIQPEEKSEGITITATLAPKTAPTKAVADNDDNKITATWAENEKIAILYEVSSTKYVAEATVTAVDGTSGAATISFSVESGTADNTPCTLVYPAKLSDGTTTVYKDDLSGVKDAATLLAAQDGTLNANLDVRVGEGTIQTTTPSLTVSTQPAAQYSIFKFTAQDISGTGITPTEFKVSDAAGNVITTVTPSASAFYVALPVLSASTYWFNATASSKPYIAKATVSTATSAGTYYQSTVKMATIGDVILSDGKFAAAGTDGQLAMIAYVGSETDHATYKHGLAIALADESGTMYWSTANSTCESKTPVVTGAAWLLPSQDQWKAMFKANGGNEGSYSGLDSALATAGGDGSRLQVVDGYWSTEYDVVVLAYFVFLVDGGAHWNVDRKDRDRRVRACLAF